MWCKSHSDLGSYCTVCINSQLQSVFLTDETRAMPKEFSVAPFQQCHYYGRQTKAVPTSCCTEHSSWAVFESRDIVWYFSCQLYVFFFAITKKCPKSESLQFFIAFNCGFPKQCNLVVSSIASAFTSMYISRTGLLCMSFKPFHLWITLRLFCVEG